MEIRRTELRSHITAVGNAIASACQVELLGPLLAKVENGSRISITIGWNGGIPDHRVRDAIGDLGNGETVVSLPIPDTTSPRYWIGAHETWDVQGPRKLNFVDCGVRIYTGGVRERLVQLLRLEWHSAEQDPDGNRVFQGGHAAHPHWHIDRSALAPVIDAHTRAIEELSRSADQPSTIEEFVPASAIAPPAGEAALDCSWLVGLHFAAQACWMHTGWERGTVPAPHQTEPENRRQLENWWLGSIRYIGAELERHAI